MLSRLWARLNLTLRVMFSAGFALTVAGGLLLFVSTGKEAGFARARLEERLAAEMEALVPAISEWVVIGDYATIEQTLRQHVGRSDIRRIAWIDASGLKLEVSDKAIATRAPEWFVAWTALPAPAGELGLEIGGRAYGAVSVQMAADRDRDRLWDAFLDHIAILGLAVGIDFFGILLILRNGLRPLRRLDAGARALEAGHLGMRLEPQGSPELVSVMAAFNRMAEAVEASQHELRCEAKRLAVILASIGDGVVTTDAAGRVDYLNPAAEAMTGWLVDAARGRPLPEVFNIVNEFSRQPAENPAEQVLRGGRPIGLGHKLLIARHGPEYPIQDSAAPIRDRQGTTIGAVLVFHDLSERRQLTRQLSWQASHDALTGLINRGEFERRLGALLAEAASCDRTHALLYVDVDQFKVINDTCGHSAGDELLRQLATRLSRSLRPADTLARIGGDEFGVLMPECQLGEALRRAAGLIERVADFHFTWHGQNFTVGLSIGAVGIDGGSGDLAEVLTAADAACYAAKEKGRNRAQAYTPEDGEIAERHGQMRWVTRIARAFEENRFELYCQPIVPIGHQGDKAGSEPHVEVLLRMRDENGRLLAPGAFVVAAERYGAIDGIDRWVFSHTLDWLDENAAQAIVCSINLSGRSINDDRFRDFVVERVRALRVPPRRICVEITETAAITSLAKAGDFIKTVRSLGCRFSLDDFGSGMASFSYLRNLPVDYLKIDGSFVRNIAHDAIDRALVETVNRIGHIMGIATIAEFVENEAVLEKLRQIGVDYGQGYVFSRPMPLVELVGVGV